MAKSINVTYTVLAKDHLNSGAKDKDKNEFVMKVDEELLTDYLSTEIEAEDGNSSMIIIPSEEVDEYDITNNILELLSDDPKLRKNMLKTFKPLEENYFDMRLYINSASFSLTNEKKIENYEFDFSSLDDDYWYINEDGELESSY